MLDKKKIGMITDLDRNEFISRIDFLDLCNQQKSLLKQYHMNPGHLVMIGSFNKIQFLANLFACWDLGLTAMPVSSNMSPWETNQLIQQFHPRLIWDLSPSSSSVQLNQDHFEHHQKELENTALILLTSGTSSASKGVKLSRKSLEYKFKTLNQLVPIQDLTTSLCLLPLSFGHGLIANALYPFLNGHHLILGQGGNLGLLSDLGSIIDSYEITFMSGTPLLWRSICELSTPPQKNSLKRVHCASAPLSLKLWSQIKNWTGSSIVKNTYGLTETGSWVFTQDDQSLYDREGLVGKPMGCELLLVPIEQSDHYEILLRSPCLMNGFYNTPQSPFNQDGFYPTGDTGILNDKGELILTGRIKHIINMGGIKISPDELRNVINSHPSINDSEVFPYLDSILGEVPACCIVRNPSDKNRPEKLLIQEIKKWLEQHLSSQKIPRHWLVLDKIPTNRRGKTDYGQLNTLVKEKGI